MRTVRYHSPACQYETMAFPGRNSGEKWVALKHALAQLTHPQEVNANVGGWGSPISREPRYWLYHVQWGTWPIARDRVASWIEGLYQEFEETSQAFGND